MMPAGRGQKIAAVALAVAGAAALLLHARAWQFVCDDAYISFRYAWNLAEHGALEYNLGERVEGYTNFSWVVVLALGTCLGALPEVLAPWLTQLGALAGAAATVVLVRALRGASAWSAADLIPAFLLAAAPEYVVWAHGGLETSWAAALTIAAMAATASGRWRAAGVATALAGLTRPDAVLPIGVFCNVFHRTCSGRQARGLPSTREAAIAAALAGGPLLVHLLWRWTYYGEWLPNTWAIKQHGRLLRDTFGSAYVTTWASALRLVWLAPLVLLLRARHAPLVLPIAAVLGYAWSVGGDFMAYGRFLIVATALTAGLVGWLLVEAGERVLGPRGPAAATCVGLALAAVLGVMSRERLMIDRATPTGWIDGRWEGVTAMDRFARERVAAGTWFKNVPEDTTISVGAAGALPYASKCGRSTCTAWSTAGRARSRCGRRRRRGRGIS
ncbi:hypothetical protein [Nannocystis pusilla]|uniref:hypothetical protein n=1 Tax=Nannocystis pusilla TaxID=889268 RepID=UPI003B808585